VRLVSGIWDKKSTSELLLEMSNKTKEHQDNMGQYQESLNTLKTFRKAENLDKALSKNSLSNPEQNVEMKRLIEFYSTFFDEDSGNTREEGIKQLRRYLIDEVKADQNEANLSKKYLDDIKKEIDIRKEVPKNKEAIEENKNIFIPIIPMHVRILFRILLTFFSFGIYFKLIDFNLNYLIPYIPEVVIPTIFTSLVLFIWEYYRLYSKARKYYKVGKTTYMFCKKKIYSFYKKK
jgi:hypothetical protein